MTTSGIHAGTLYRLGQEGALYFVDDRGTKSPFAGPFGMHKLMEGMGYQVTQIIDEELI